MVIVTLQSRDFDSDKYIGIYLSRYEAFEALREFIEPNLEEGEDIEDAYNDTYKEWVFDEKNDCDFTEEELKVIEEDIKDCQRTSEEAYTSAYNKIAKFADDTFNFESSDGSWGQLCEFDNSDSISYQKNGLYFGSDVENQCGIATFLSEGGFQ